MRNKRKFNQKGITLVALVVTIIILLILAGITISQITGENGLFNYAKMARNNILNAQSLENDILQNYNITIDNTLGEKNDSENDKERKYTISYKTNIGTGSIESVSVKSDTTIKLSNNENGFLNEGFEVTAWIDEDGNEYSLGQEIQITENMVLAAKWIEQGRVYLYNNGDECENVTGGWAFTPNPIGGGNYSGSARTKESDHIYLKSMGDSFNCGRVFASTVNAIDFSQYKKLYYELRYVSTNQPNIWAHVSIAKTNTQPFYSSGNSLKDDISCNGANKDIRTTIEVDISDLNENGYIQLSPQVNYSNHSCAMYIYKVYVEK